LGRKLTEEEGDKIRYEYFSSALSFYGLDKSTKRDWSEFFSECFAEYMSGHPRSGGVAVELMSLILNKIQK